MTTPSTPGVIRHVPMKTEDGKSRRGFASMDPERQREIASQGGRAAHEKGTAHEFTSVEAREAGKKGGMKRAANRKALENKSV